MEGGDEGERRRRKSEEQSFRRRNTQREDEEEKGDKRGKQRARDEGKLQTLERGESPREGEREFAG